MGKILIVDDEPGVQKVLEIVLQSASLETQCVSNGRSAINAVNGGEISLIFLDCFLPDMDGIEVAKQIRNSAKGANVPIIFISASAEKIQDIPAMKMSEKFVKPVPNDVLINTAKKYVA
ncbi:MAG: response regulator [Chlamydiales bacterium]|nr:response regulator [Chlamydiales bacterium]